MQQEPIVEIRNVSFGYEAARPVLRDIDLAIERGAVVGIMGQSGCGKTTLIKCLLDLVACDAGEAEIFGVPSRRPQARARLAYLPERFVPPHYLRAREFVASMLELAGERYDPAAAVKMLEALELEARALEQPVRNLSKGMTQKLGLAACFLAQRDLYVLDEPMSGLDPAARVALKSLLSRLAAEGKTLFFTSHVLADVEELCASLAVLDAGRVRFRGSPAELAARYAEKNLERAFMRCLRDTAAAASAA